MDNENDQDHVNGSVKADAEAITETSTTEEHPSSKSSTADEASSIEALNWSDFEEDEITNSGIDTALLQSIHSVMSDSIEETGTKMSTSASSERTIDVRVDNATSNEPEDVIEESASALAVKQGTKRKREEDESPIMDTLTVAAGNNEVSGDLSSNAAVLDDGPIWAKGSKRYKFEENRRINQKLTFGVLLSVVLAVGLGLGNLVAYNECEAEHKDKEVPCPMASKSPPQPPPAPSLPTLPSRDDPLMTSASSLPTPEVHIPQVTIPITEFPQLLPKASNRPMVDPKYAQHAEELSRVLKILDELSRKIDRFENTTRQLGGIVMMKDDIRPRAPPTKKAKFLKLLSEVMATKKAKKAAAGVKAGQVKTWKDKKEEVLDEIAGAVLEAMQDEGLDSDVEEAETFLEDTQTFPIDQENVLEESLPASSLPVVDPSSDSNSIVDSAPIFENPEDGIIGPEVQPNYQHKTKNAKVLKSKEVKPKELKPKDAKPKDVKLKEDKPRDVKPKLKRDVAVDLTDEELEPKRKQKEHKHSREDFQNDNTAVKQEEFRKQKHQKFEKHQAQDLKEDKAKKQKQESDPDWNTLRAENRDANRRASEEKIKKPKKNWQAERSRIREEFRRAPKFPTHYENNRPIPA